MTNPMEITGIGSLEVKLSPEIIERAKAEAFSQLKNHIEKFDFTQFSWESFYLHMKNFKSEIVSGDVTSNFDLGSFSDQEMVGIWLMLDQKLTELRNTHLAQIKEGSEEYRLINSSTKKWFMDYDGKVKPYVENPVLLGGVHGDEHTLPDEFNRLLKYNNEVGLYRLNSDRSYINHEVNIGALSENERSFSVSENRPDERADMNRSQIDDPVTLEAKTQTLKEIARLGKPFIVDMHNERHLDENGLEQKSYIAFVDTDHTLSKTGQISEKLIFKIKLAQELGIGKIIIADPEIAKGALVEDIKTYNENADGMVVEVPDNDTHHTSSKIALKYLAINGVINGGQPSIPIQMQYLLGDTFIPVKTDAEMEILLYSVNRDVDQNLHPINIKEGEEYMVRNGVPIVMKGIKI